MRHPGRFLAGTTCWLIVDLLADDRDGLLVDTGRVPRLDGPEIGLSRLVATAAFPAIGTQVVGRGRQRIGF